ncbi:MAG TPA: RagB/SusD family nutrient uptake outer membrane protein [Sediminibacterium sp.]|uniref:RagB/SusD family nutrient uptake outer membrane protein n=1 Tax=Sediminibacterium sp. TaxID=1917865 RepID=UPI0008B4CC22|nr:RagB/SusD family nutrient uptake outer membrane protein [Sediminibacterium sp.]OHC86715.1 MAG: carbohydrate-binding protein SusD [Sphingobacteriia bacterium RIFOXYC2_FULL_35_18]OHC88427.1 MAG: carbohydrate-binding protein SusD [Sphingobacteriia bacterium RIFOXYD2_FULL_35_12]HLD51926.1 RagB/SusD family nutrient uptake outer membrane protein [Sediminibacterium sp.]
MKKNLIYVLMAAGLVQLSSCAKENFVNPVPTNVISDLTAFDSKDRIEGQVRSIYASIKNAGMYGGRYQIFNDIRGGDFMNDRTNVVTGFDVWNYTPSNSSTNSVQNHWSRAYYVINLSNVFLDGMAAKGTAVVGATISNNYQAEARLLRAMSYYSLLQLYARPFWDGNGSKPGVPLRLKGNTGSDNYALARATVAEVYTQILADLNFAETNLPTTNSSAINNTTRAHRNTAIALKTRVYLSMRRYADVITEANKIVSANAPFTATSGVAHALQSDVTNVFKAPYTTTESIFSMPFASNEAPGGQNQLGYYYGPAAFNGGNGEYSLLSTGIVSNAGWKTTDRRRAMVGVYGGKSYLTKYSVPSIFTDYAPVIRYAEVLLNLAEARVRSTNTVDAQAIALLNAVRGRSDASTVFTAADFANSDALANAILTERRIELLGEGLAGTDLTRLGLPLPAKPGVAAIAATAQQYIWPISSSELLLNPLCTDN